MALILLPLDLKPLPRTGRRAAPARQSPSPAPNRDARQRRRAAARLKEML